MDDIQDIELDADVHQSSMVGGPQTVRKIISLNLTKKTKLKRNEVKSSKSKKERRDRDEDSESKSSRRNKILEKRKEATDDDEREDEELDWSHKVIFIGEKVQDPMIHVCEKCTLPILIYGRLSPCKHVFCLSCAEKSNGSCTRCDERIDRIEPAGIGQIFVCSFGGSRNGISGCRRSYLSQRDLFAHIKHRHEKEGSTIPETELVRQQGVMRMPFLNATSGMIVQPGINIQSAGQTAGLGGAVVLTGIQPGTQQPIVVDPNRVPLIMGTQAQFSSITQGLIAQAQFPGATYFPQGLPAQMSALPSTGGGSRQGDLPPSRSGAMQRVPPVRQHGEWRGGEQMPPSAQDWANQGRPGNYQQQYYK